MLLLVSNHSSALRQVWEERARDGFIVLNTAKLLLAPLPSSFPCEKVLVINLELLQLAFVAQKSRVAVLNWLEKVLSTAEQCVATWLSSSIRAFSDTSKDNDNERTLFKLKLMFSNVVTLAPPRPNNIVLTPSSAFWAPIVGYDKVKTELDKLIRWRFERKASLNAMGIHSSATSHCLLYGPSGNGKTFIARNFARLGSKDIGFISLKASDVFSKWYGDSEKRIREAFQRAREQRPCILYLDEVEALAPSRSNNGESDGANGVNARVLSTLLNEMDGVDTENDDLVVIACTNRMEMVDDAILRPGRLGNLVLVDHPAEPDRRLLLASFLHNTTLEQEEMEWLAMERTVGYSVLQIETMCSKAKFSAMRRGSESISKADFIV